MPRVITNRKSGFIRRDGGMRRDTLWVGTSVIQATAGLPNISTLLTSFGASVLALRPFTIVRTRGTMLLRSDQGAASEDYSAAYGHCIVTDQAASVGISAVPTPNSDIDSDSFYVFESLLGDLQVITAIGLYEAGVKKDFDSKAMRKVEDGFDSVSVVESGVLSAGWSFQVQFRQLIKLH